MNTLSGVTTLYNKGHSSQGASHLTSQTRLKFFSHLIVMYLSVLIGNPNDAKRHLLSIFVQIQLTVTNRTFIDYGCF